MLSTSTDTAAWTRAHQFAHWDALQVIGETQPCTSYLEVGVSWGHSLKVLLQYATPARITLCDSWGSQYGGEGFGGHDHIRLVLKEARYTGRVTFLDGNSHLLLKRVRSQFDVILVDGDHSADGARQDLQDCWALLRPNGVLVFDDICHPSHADLMGVFETFCVDVDADVVAVLTKPMGCAVLRKRATGR